MASEPDSLEIAFDVTRMKSDLQHVQFGAHGERYELNVNCLQYTQENIGRRFRDGRPLERLIHDLNSGEVKPLEHPSMQLEVVRQIRRGREVYYSTA